MREYAITIMKELTEAPGLPGYEQPIRNIIKKYIDGEYITDKTGSIYVLRKGSADRPKIMVCGHLDEVGFVVQSITKEGFLHFVTMGGIWGLTMLSQRVKVHIDNEKFIHGTIAYRSPHYLNTEDRTRFIQPTDMFIDIGANDYDDAVLNYHVEVGQQVTFDTEFTRLANPYRFMAKAFDNRVGVGIAMTVANELLNCEHPNIVYAGANAQEEVKARGAITAAHLINPDLGIVVEGAPADDTPGMDPHTRQATLGGGVQIRVMDLSAIMNQQFNRFIIGIAKELDIPVQMSVRLNGGTDAHAIHLNSIGVPSCVLGVPVRYSHTSNSILDMNDYLKCLHLVMEMLRRLDEKTVNSFTQF
jgi:endoglucanase